MRLKHIIILQNKAVLLEFLSWQREMCRWS